VYYANNWVFLVSDPLCLSSYLALHFSNYSFWSTTLLTGMTGISLHMHWPLTSQLHGSVSQREQLFFFVTDQTPRPQITELFYKLSIGRSIK
jgi:hypothetical protein